MEWANEEMDALDLGDTRLNNRAISILNTLGNSPSDSIPASCKGWSETKAAYRFFDHNNVTVDKLFEPHKQATLKRIKQHPVVLFVQDTSTLTYTGQKQRTDIGPINRDNTRGLFIHPTLALTPDCLCLGIIDHYKWARKKLAHQTSKERSRTNHTRDISEKESYRWIESYRKANAYAQQLPKTMVVSVSDREGDLYELFQEVEKNFMCNSAHFLVRSSFDRTVIDEEGKRCHDKLIAQVKKSGVIGKITFKLPSANKRENRTIEQAVYIKEVTLSPPDRKRKKHGYKPVKTNVIIATEIDPPKNTKPLEWVLLTSISVKNFENARQIIQWYLCRWQIEIYFKILKSGCAIEKLQLTKGSRFDICLALYMIIAWRILFITMLGRDCPNISCECIFDKIEWQTVFVVLHKKKPPSKPPNLNEMIKMIASSGGFLNRKCDGDPGPKPMWIGMRNMYEHIKAREAFEQAFGHTYG